MSGNKRNSLFSKLVQLPPNLRRAEETAIRIRRRKWPKLDADEQDAQPIGLALSGGGVRSAAYSLGILQGLHQRGLLRFIDYLSTVSGGGYAGAYLTSSVQKHRPRVRNPERDPQQHLDQLLGPADGSAPATTPDSGRPLEGLQQLEHRGHFLVQTLKFLNYGTISLVLLWTFMLSGLLAYASFTAWLFRNLDYVTVRNALNPLGVQDDVTLAFFPCAVLFFLFLFAWLCSAVRHGPRCTGRWATPFLIAAAYTFAVAAVSLLVTGDLSATYFDALFGANTSKTVWDYFGRFATNIAIGALTASLLPFLRPHALLRSGYAPRGQLHEWVFLISSYALLIGVPLVCVAIAAREDRTGIYRNRSDVRLEFVELKDWGDPDPARNAFWRDFEGLVNTSGVKHLLTDELNKIELRYQERRQMMEASGAYRWDRHLPGTGVSAIARTDGPLPNRIPARVGWRYALSSGWSWLGNSLGLQRVWPAVFAPGQHSYLQLAENVAAVSKHKRALTNQLNELLVRTDFPNILAMSAADNSPRFHGPRDEVWKKYVQHEIEQARFDCGEACGAGDEPLLSLVTRNALTTTSWLRPGFGPFTDEREIQQTSYFVVPGNMPESEVQRLELQYQQWGVPQADRSPPDDVWKTSLTASRLSAPSTNADRSVKATHNYAVSLRQRLMDERDRKLKVLAANRRLLTAYYTAPEFTDGKAEMHPERNSRLQPATRVFSWVVLEADQQSRWNVFVLSFLLFVLVGFALTDLNVLSWHGYYREQIQQTWMPDLSRSRPQQLHRCRPYRFGLPYPLINAAVHQNHLSVDPDRSPRDFVFSPAYCGGETTGFIRTRPLSQRKRRGFDLADAVAVSGAAVSPLLVQNLLVRILMFLGNMRFGQWVANPGTSTRWRPFRRWLPLGPLAVPVFWVRVHLQRFWSHCWRLGWENAHRARPRDAQRRCRLRAAALALATVLACGFLVWLLYRIGTSTSTLVWKRALLAAVGLMLCLAGSVATALVCGWKGVARPRDSRDPRNLSASFGGLYCFATDGGHFDNTGIDVLLQRRCRVIFAADATEDKFYRYGELSRLIRRWQSKHPDFQIEWQSLDNDPDGLRADLGALKPKIETEKDKDQADPRVLRLQAAAARPFAVGVIHYPKQDGHPAERGLLIYFKPTLYEGLPQDVRQFSDDNPLFPQEPSSDIVYEYEQFASYRKLGQHAVAQFDKIVLRGISVAMPGSLIPTVAASLRDPQWQQQGTIVAGVETGSIPAAPTVRLATAIPPISVPTVAAWPSAPSRTLDSVRQAWKLKQREHCLARTEKHLQDLVEQLCNGPSEDSQILSTHARLVDCGVPALKVCREKLGRILPRNKHDDGIVWERDPNREMVTKLLDVVFDIVSNMKDGKGRLRELDYWHKAIHRQKWSHEVFRGHLDKLNYGTFPPDAIERIVGLYNFEEAGANEN